MPGPTVEDDKVMAKIRVMVVEDEGLVALSPQRKLRNLGYEIPAIAATGEQAIQRATELRSALRPPCGTQFSIRLPKRTAPLPDIMAVRSWVWLSARW